MNTSRRTRIVADGLALWAAVQDLPGNAPDDNYDRRCWERWAAENRAYVAFVKCEQDQLFNRVNAAF